MIRETELREKIRFSRNTIEQWDPESATTLELNIEADLQALRDQLEEANEAASDVEPDPLEEALDETRKPGAGHGGHEPPQLNEPGQQGQQGQQGSARTNKASRTSKASRVNKANRVNKASRVSKANRVNKASRVSKANRAGSRLGGFGGGNDNDGFERRMATSEAATIGTAGAPRQLTDEELRQYRAQMEQRADQIRDLQERFARHGPTGQTSSIRCSRLDDAPRRPWRHDRSARALAEIHQGMLDQLKRMEFGLRREVEGETGQQPDAHGLRRRAGRVQKRDGRGVLPGARTRRGRLEPTEWRQPERPRRLGSDGRAAGVTRCPLRALHDRRPDEPEASQGSHVRTSVHLPHASGFRRSSRPSGRSSGTSTCPSTPGGKDRRRRAPTGQERARSCASWPASTRTSSAKRGRRRGQGSRICPRSQSSIPSLDVKRQRPSRPWRSDPRELLNALRGGEPASSAKSRQRRGDGRPHRAAGQAAGPHRRGGCLGARPPKIEIAMDALRLPPGDTDVGTLSGWRAPGEWRCAVCSSSSRTCFCSTSPPTTWTPNPSPGSSTIFDEFPGHDRRDHARPLLPRQRRRVDPRVGPRGRHPLEGELFVLARAEAGATAGWRRRASPPDRRPSSESSIGSACPHAPGTRRARPASTPTRSCWPG